MSFRSEIVDALAEYDAVVDDDGATEAGVVEAAIDCIAAVRVALEAEPVPNMNNPVAQLQEMAQAKGIALPDYQFVSIGNVHAPEFKCTCTFEGRVSRSTAPNKQKAKRRAAGGLLSVLVGGSS